MGGGTQTVAAGIRSVGHLASPRYWRWRRFLRSLALDPDTLPRPLPSPGTNDVLVCGSPRSGTSLVCGALFQPPSCVTVMEPWDGMRLPPTELFASLRDEIDGSGRLRRGKLDVEALLSDGAVRWCGEGQGRFAVPTQGSYVLAVKWPAFWRYLDLLPETKFIVCLRHPVEVINSYRTTGGRLAQGYDYDVAFNRRMNDDLRAATNDAAVRRVLLYDYINAQILPHLTRRNVLSLRYERWFTEPNLVLAELSEFLGKDVTRSRAAIVPPRSRPDAPVEEMELIRRYCKTAEPLGYSV